MRNASARDTLVQFLLALFLLIPLTAAFWHDGGFQDAFNNSTSARISTFATAGGRSVLVGGMSVLIAALIGIPAAWALASRRNSIFLTALIVLPLALPAPVAVSGWIRLIAPSATSSFALQLPGAPAAGGVFARDFLFSPFGVALVLGFGFWPIVALNAWPGFRRARDESYQAARLYASPCAPFCGLFSRDAKAKSSGIALVFLLSCNDFAVSSLLLVHTLPVEVHDQAALGKNAAAAWASLPLVLLAGALCVVALRGGTKSYGTLL